MWSALPHPLTHTHTHTLTEDKAKRDLVDAKHQADNNMTHPLPSPPPTLTEDKAKRDLVDAKNQADSMVYQTEKQLKELADKLPEEVKTAVEGKLAAVREAIPTDDAAKVGGWVVRGWVGGQGVGRVKWVGWGVGGWVKWVGGDVGGRPGVGRGILEGGCAPHRSAPRFPRCLNPPCPTHPRPPARLLVVNTNRSRARWRSCKRRL